MIKEERKIRKEKKLLNYSLHTTTIYKSKKEINETKNKTIASVFYIVFFCYNRKRTGKTSYRNCEGHQRSSGTQCKLHCKGNNAGRHYGCKRSLFRIGKKFRSRIGI